MSSRIYSCLLNIDLFTYTFSHAHTEAEAHTHEHTRIISTQEKWRQPGTGAWLRWAEERRLFKTKKGLAHQDKKKGGKNVRKTRYSRI